MTLPVSRALTKLSPSLLAAFRTARSWAQGRFPAGRTVKKAERNLLKRYRWNTSALSSGNSLTCALTGTGEVYCWNDPYTVSHGNATAIAQVSGLKDATMLSVGADHACALIREGSVRCWGRNAAAQLGSLYNLMQPGLPVDGGMTAHVVFGFADDAAH